MIRFEFHSFLKEQKRKWLQLMLRQDRQGEFLRGLDVMSDKLIFAAQGTSNKVFKPFYSIRGLLGINYVTQYSDGGLCGAIGQQVFV